MVCFFLFSILLKFTFQIKRSLCYSELERFYGRTQKLAIGHWRRSGIFIVNFEHISHLALVFLLLTLSM